jgi:uncharacterized protein
MAVLELQRHPSATQPQRQSWVAAHPVVAFVIGAFAFSWLSWGASWLVGGMAGNVLFVIGAFGPALAAATVVHRTGGSVRAWIAPLAKWRVPARYYAYALGLPMLVVGAMNGVMAALGYEIVPSLLVDRLPMYLATMAFVAVLGGGQEEPGWRGFALARLQARWSPMRATLVLGLVWGLWHLPIYGPVGWLLPMLLAFFYTYLFNRTGSVLLCVLLHASFTPALENLILVPEQVHGVGDAVIGLTVLAAVLVLVAATRGRLGLRTD